MKWQPVTRRAALKFAALITLMADGMGELRSAPRSRGYGTDPNLLKREVPWPRTTNSSMLAALASLCDIVLPADPPHPSASEIGVHEFIDEWISAPYPQMQIDRGLVHEGMRFLDEAMRKETGRFFANSRLKDQIAIFDRMCVAQPASTFARRIIELICAGYYTTREGHAAIGYVGNVPLKTFPGPTPEIIQRLEKSLDELPVRLAQI